jgi:histone-lysine N-methyltransferase SETMAR
MALVFWDAEGILFIDYLENGKTITGEYYSSLLIRLDKKFVRKETVCKRKNCLSSGQCTRPQKCFCNGKLRDLHYEVLEHPPYYPDLAPSEFCIFPKTECLWLGSVFLRIKRRLQL